MLRTALLAGLLAATATPAFADEAAAPAAASAAYSTETTTIGQMIDDTAAKAVLDKYLPGMSDNPQIEMARGMTLKQIQPFASDTVTDAALANMDADFAKLPKKD